jgi:hypothetical protein
MTGGDGHAAQAPLNDRDTAPFNGPHFGVIPTWVARRGDLTRYEHRVLIIIASHARKETRIAVLSIKTIAAEANIDDRRNVQRAIRGLEAKGALKLLRVGGQGRSNEYQIVFKAPEAEAANGVSGDVVSEADEAANSVSGDTETASFETPNSFSGDAPTESEQKERTDPPAGESPARARGEDFSNDEVDGRQEVLLLPFNRRGDRRALLKRYNPSAALVDWAREQYGVNALDDRVLGKFIDWHIKHPDKLPVDIEAIEAAYRNWIRDQPRFSEQSRHRPQQHSNASEAETAAAAEFFERMRAMTANGAGQ